MNLLARHIWRVASVAALVGLQAPLCALACLEGQPAEPTLAQHSQAPCHEQDRVPDDTPSSDDGCGCEIAREAFLPASEASWSVLTLVFAVPHGVLVPPDAEARWKPAVPEASDLPPPDILLLKSTLLI